MHDNMPGFFIFFVLLLFSIGIVVGAAVAVKYYENEGCRLICSGKIQIMKFSDDSPPAYPAWDGEKQYERL